MGMFRKILVALDDSEASQQVYEQALALAKSVDAQLMLLHVLSPLEDGYPDITVYAGVESYYPMLHGSAVKRYLEQCSVLEEQYRERLQSLAAKANAAGVTTEFTLNLGNPGRAICTLARTWEADLLVTGRRGHSGLSEWVLGSVSNYVLHHAPCSVLTVQHIATSPLVDTNPDSQTTTPAP